MSQSPAEAADLNQARDPRSEYRRQLKRLDALINRGGSLSGQERNCAFLNLGNGVGGSRQFATVSSVTGIDFTDDGRAYGLTDWDDDGDIDVWTMNRTGPRVRYLRNDQSSGYHFLSLRIVGRTCNRDAIGASVEVHVDAPAARRLIKVVRAGDGFLSQSSKQLLFGLGPIAKITHVTVRWPGGDQETFRGCHVDRRYELIQGSGVARPVRRDQPGAHRLTDDERVKSPSTDQAAILLASQLALPRMRYATVDGQTHNLSDLDPGPVLVNLWASWCLPCQQELHELASAAAGLRRQGLQVLALSVDGRTDVAFSNEAGIREGVHRANAIIAELGALRMGFATRDLLDRFQFFEDLLFSQKRPLVIPTSYLIDQEGRLAAIYRGPIDLPILKRHLDQLRLRGKARYDAALPFAGVWYRPNSQRASIKLSAQMFSNGYPLDAAQFTLAHQDVLSGQPGFVTLAGQLASRLAAQEEATAAIDLYRAALQRSPQNVPILNNLAWELSTHPDPTHRDADEAVRWARQAAALTRYKSARVLDTLATALGEAGDTDGALKARRLGLEAAREANDKPMIKKLEAAIRKVDSK